MTETLSTDIETRRPPLRTRVLHSLKRNVRIVRRKIHYRVKRGRLYPSIKADKPAHVIVAGAGLAGLASALELERAGHRVTLLEANSQIAGRASTIREPFAEGLHIDTGGFRFHAHHYRVRHYLNEFGLTSAPFYPVLGDGLIYLDGVLIRRRIGEPVDPQWLPRPLTEPEQWMFNQETCAQVSRINGGVDQLATGFYNRFTAKPRLGCEATGVEQTSSGVRVTVRCDGDSEELTADFLVLATANSVLEGLDIAPAFPAAKQQVHDKVEYRDGLLVFMELPTEYWLEQKLAGFAVTDRVGELWTPDLDPAQPTTLTLSYTKNEKARELLNMPLSERARVIIGRLEDFLPYFSSFVKQHVVLSWNEERLMGGTAASAMFMSEAEKALLRQPHGRIHFAGEHMAGGGNMGWMEGALESAQRVVREISAA